MPSAPQSSRSGIPIAPSVWRGMGSLLSSCVGAFRFLLYPDGGVAALHMAMAAYVGPRASLGGSATPVAEIEAGGILWAANLGEAGPVEFEAEKAALVAAGSVGNTWLCIPPTHLDDLTKFNRSEVLTRRVERADAYSSRWLRVCSTFVDAVRTVQAIDETWTVHNVGTETPTALRTDGGVLELRCEFEHQVALTRLAGIVEGEGMQ